MQPETKKALELRGDDPELFRALDLLFEIVADDLTVGELKDTILTYISDTEAQEIDSKRYGQRVVEIVKSFLKNKLEGLQ